MDSHMDLLGELASDAALERSDFIFQATEQLRKFLDHHRERIAVIGGLTLIDEEPDYLSIAPDLHVPKPEPVPGRDHRRMGQRDGGHRIGRRADRALQPGRHLRRIRRRRPRGGRTARPSRPPRARCSRRPGSRRGDRRVRRGPVRRGRRLVGRRPAGRARATDDEESAARRLYDLALEYQERSQRSEAAAPRGVRGRRGRARRGRRRPDHRRRRRRAADAHGDRRVSGPRSSPRSRGRVADARRAPTSWSGSTTRPTSSATSPTRSPRRIPSVAPELAGRRGRRTARRRETPTRPRPRGRRRRGRRT